MVKEVVPFKGMLAAAKALAMVGGATTVSSAVLLVAPVPPSVEVMGPAVLFLLPGEVAVTLTEKVQVKPGNGAAVSEPPERVMKPFPAAAVTVPLPQPPVIAGMADTATPAGKPSLKAIPLSALAFGLVMMNVRVLLPFTATVAGEKDLVKVGGATTVRGALEVLPGPPSLEVTVTALIFAPALIANTLTEKVQEEPGVSVPPARVMVLLSIGAETVPVPQVPTGAAFTKTPFGRVSVNATPVSGTVVFGLVMTKVRVLAVFTGMLAGLKDLTMLGGAATVRLAVAVLPEPPLVELTAPVVLV